VGKCLIDDARDYVPEAGLKRADESIADSPALFVRLLASARESRKGQLREALAESGLELARVAISRTPAAPASLLLAHIGCVAERLASLLISIIEDDVTLDVDIADLPSHRLPSL